MFINFIHTYVFLHFSCPINVQHLRQYVLILYSIDKHSKQIKEHKENKFIISGEGLFQNTLSFSGTLIE